MKQSAFEENHQPTWNSLSELLDDPKSIKTDSEFPKMYRALCRHLAVARSRHYSNSLVQHLESLVQKGHQHFYRSQGNVKFRMINYFAREFPALIRKEWRLVAFSHVLFYLPFFLLLILIQYHPHVSYMVLSDDIIIGMEESYNPANKHFEEQREASSDVMMLGYYIRNNVGIDFQCFAGGIFAGVGSIFYMFYNGLIIGAVAGHVTQLGYGSTFWPFVCGHSALELTAAVFAGACGMKMGFALIRPGRHSRMHALKKASGTAIRMLYGTAFMTFCAAFIEAFWSSSAAIPVNVKYTFAACFWTALIAYFLFAGRGYEPE